METTTVLSSNNTIPVFALIRPYDIYINIIGILVGGLLGLISNVFILTVIRKNKILQTPCFLMICGEYVCSLFLSISFITLSIQEFAGLIGFMNSTRPRVVCYISIALLGLFSAQASKLIINCVALDRLISVVSPIMYRQIGNRYVKACWLFSFVYAALAAFGEILIDSSSPMTTVECVSGVSAVDIGYLAYYGVFNLIFSGLCLILYASLLIGFKWRLKTIMDQNVARTFQKQQKASLPTVKLLLIIYGTTTVLPEIWICIISSSQLTAAYAPRTIYYVGPIKACSTLAQIIALYVGSAKFRNCAKAQLGIGGQTEIAAPVLTIAHQRIRPVP